jgi:hypothetical protein
VYMFRCSQPKRTRFLYINHLRKPEMLYEPLGIKIHKRFLANYCKKTYFIPNNQPIESRTVKSHYSNTQNHKSASPYVPQARSNHQKPHSYRAG